VLGGGPVPPGKEAILGRTSPGPLESIGNVWRAGAITNLIR